MKKNVNTHEVLFCEFVINVACIETFCCYDLAEGKIMAENRCSFWCYYSDDYFTETHLCASAQSVRSATSNVKVCHFHRDNSFILPRRVDYHLLNSFSFWSSKRLTRQNVRKRAFRKNHRVWSGNGNKNDLFKFNFF